jgi:hypothetical protein
LRSSVIFFLAFSLLMGLAQVFLLPPWEGFDETAHFSYIQQIAESHTLPINGAWLSYEIDEYATQSPMPYSSAPPFSDSRYWTYYRFFESSQNTTQTGWNAIHIPQERSFGWRAGSVPNWEAQHPPLYYLLLSPLYSYSRNWNLLHQLFLLRAVSYGFAWLSLCLTAIVTWTRDATPGPTFESQAATFLGAGLWPYLLPMWFPEMARLGNDSLIALILAFAWIAFRRLIFRKDRLLDYVLVALLCGLGLLTKATFLPFLAVILGVLIYRLWEARRDAIEARKRILGLTTVLVIVVAIAGWWYWRQLQETGTVLGANDLIAMEHSGGLAAVLSKSHLIQRLAYGVVQVPLSFLWSGTWSFVEPPAATVLPFLGIAGVLLAGHLLWLRKVGGPVERVPVLTLAVFGVGLSYSVLAFIVAYDRAGTPGWYLHSFAPLFAVIAGTGLIVMANLRRFRVALSCLLLYPLVFLPIAAVFEALTYSGCGQKTASWAILGSLSYDPGHSPLTCLTHSSVMFQNLAVLGSPTSALVCFVGGWMAAVVGLILLRRNLSYSEIP